MQLKYILLILSWILLLAGIVLIVLSFTVNLSQYYGAVALGLGAILSLVAVILWRRDIKRRDEEAQQAIRKQKK